MRKVTFVLMLVAFVLSGSVVLASDHDKIKEPNVSYRVKVMRAIGANMGAIGDIFKHGLPFNDAVAVHASNIESSAKLVASAFEKNATDKASTALPKIWKDFAKFKAGSEDMVKAASELAAAAGSGNKGQIMGAMKNLGDTCKECHKAFREKRK